MGLILEYEEGQTPLSEEEKEGLLINTITTHGELDEHEQLNIEEAMVWLIKTKVKKERILTETFMKALHKKMFGNVWSWAGVLRKSEKNIGVKWEIIGSELQMLLDDTKYWIAHETYPEEEIAIRFKHRLVSIHCFANGNGRHSRMMADMLMESAFNKAPFSWNQGNGELDHQIRQSYIKAVRAGDAGNMQPLIDFARG
jgi:Fic-DOC domain mobile mystery protein B